MCDLGRVLRLDARRTALLFAVPVLAVAGVAAAWWNLIPGVAYWDNAVIAINSFNRINVAFRIEGGNYQPGMFKNLLKTA